MSNDHTPPDGRDIDPRFTDFDYPPYPHDMTDEGRLWTKCLDLYIQTVINYGDPYWEPFTKWANLNAGVKTVDTPLDYSVEAWRDIHVALEKHAEDIAW